MPSMIRVFTGLAALCPALCFATTPALAQTGAPPMVSASDIEGVANTLRAAGYDLETAPRDGENSARIDIEIAGEYTSVIFYDCDEAVPDFCDTMILSTWWDRETPISDEALSAANRNLPYVSLFRDDDGDPNMQWAILTRREGVPATVFLNALQRFLQVANDFSAIAFEGDEGAQAAVAATEAAATGAAAVEAAQ